jgi:tetratricopeptide (TPR) repeat protein
MRAPGFRLSSGVAVLLLLAGCGSTATRGSLAPRDRAKLYSDELPDGGGHLAMGDRAHGKGGPVLRAHEVHPDPSIFALAPVGPRPAFPADLVAAKVKLNDLERTLLDSPRSYGINPLSSAGDSNLDELLGATPEEANPFIGVRRTASGKELLLLAPPEPAAAAWKRGEEAFRKSDFHGARDAFEEVLRAAPELSRALVYLGQIAETGSGGPAAGLPFYRRAVAANPVDTEAHRFLAEALLATGDAKGAEEEILHALLYSPRNVWAWTRLSALAKGADVASPRFEPAIRVELKRDGTVAVGYLEEGASYAVPYAMCKAAMRYEPALWRDATGLTGSYVRSEMEEEYCVRIVLASYLDARSGGKGGAGAGDPGVPSIPYLDYVLRVEAAGMLRQFVLFDVIGARAPHRMALLPDDEQEKVLTYLRTFATHGAGAKPGSDI